MDFDPRDYDSRDEDRAPTLDRGVRGASDRDDDRDDDWAGLPGSLGSGTTTGGTSAAGPETRANRIPPSAVVMPAMMPAGPNGTGANGRATPIHARRSRGT